MKLIIGFLVMWLIGALAGCGVKAGSSFVVGTTGFLKEAQNKEVKKEQWDNYSKKDKLKLSQLMGNI